MGHSERLRQNYERFVRLPWSKNQAGKQRVWFAVYPPSEERRIRVKMPEFQMVTIDAGHKWKLVDITGLPPAWLAAHTYKDGYFSDPTAIQTVEEDIRDCVVKELRTALEAKDVDAETVVAVQGAGALYGFAHVSPIIERIEDAIRGRLLVFFPGEYERNLYRFMDARDGFNYMAVPITSNESELLP